MNRKHNVVFIDFDGVLVNKKSWRVRSGLNATADPDCVDVLNEITDKANAVLVVSSSWRIGQSREQIARILKSWGVKARVAGMTPVLLGAERGKEILRFLERNRRAVRDFVILDDDDDMHPYRHKLVQTEFDYGLRHEHIGMALGKISP